MSAHFSPSKNTDDQIKPAAYSRLRGCSPQLCQFVIEELRIQEVDHVLDFGCGPGENTALLAALSHASVEGVDLDQERISYARTLYPSLIFHHGNVESLSLVDNNFSVATMMLSVQRFSNRAKVFRQVSRVLQERGRIGIVTVSPEQLAKRPDFRVFPTALRLESKRFPPIAKLQEELTIREFAVAKIQQFSEVIRPLDTEFLHWLKKYPFSVLHKIPPEEFRSGIETIDRLIRNTSTVQLVRNEYTLITAIKRREH